LELYDEALAEMAGTIEYYNEQREGLGAEFREAVEAVLDNIQHRPFSYPVIAASNVRRVLTNRFPFAIIYRVENDMIVIVSVFHTSRNPIIWKGRID
jgi:toxin ParE1/3/4